MFSLDSFSIISGHFYCNPITGPRAARSERRRKAVSIRMDTYRSASAAASAAAGQMTRTNIGVVYDNAGRTKPNCCTFN
jgi:hypothetical protein